MEVNVERPSPCVARISFTVPSAEFEGLVRRGLANVGRNVRMKGFRPGKIPATVLEKSHGTQVRREAVEHFAREAMDRAVEEHSFEVVGFQRIDLDKSMPLAGADLQQSIEVSLRPEVELGDYTGLEVDSALHPVMDQEVDGALHDLRAQRAVPEPAGEEGLPDDGMALCKVVWEKDGENLLERDGLRLSPETPTPGVDPEAFQKALQGAKDGQEVELEMTIPPDFEREELRGQPATTRVTVTQAFRMVPPPDEEIFKLLGVEDEEGLRKEVSRRIEEAKSEQEERRIENALLDRLLASHAVELPEPLVEQQTQARLARMRQEFQQQGAPEDELEAHLESQKDALREEAEKGLRALFLMQAIARKEELLVSQEDLRAELESIAERNQATLDEVSQYYRENNLMDSMGVEILERKVRRFLREKAVVREPS